MSLLTSPVLGVEKLVDVDAHEGPVFVADEPALYFTSLPKPGPEVAIKRLDLDTLEVTVVRESANGANGMTLAPDGRLLVCEQGTRHERARISAVDPATGEAETVVDALAGLPLNSPNDVVVAADGSIWFTDPSYGFLQGFKPDPAHGDYVYRYADGRLVVVDDSFDKPNGLAFSPDESILYVGDSGANQERGSFYPGRPHHIRAFDVVDGRRLENGRLFATITPGFPDGIKVDAEGRVYSSSFSGVQIFSPDAELLGEIALPGAVNFAFGDSTLFITTDTAIWAAELSAKGA
ncbi:MAG TPA: SMP-30/gluconolactonase/LRE family protein [Gaiellaceae bacterium]|nr:SMP-30/gluconolactonase/LRE family protein [Gaiellaceae bacterium]